MDHIRRETLNLKGLTCLVLDEADEMLRMGFIDDVEWIMEHTPPKRQIALFSATIPAAIRRIAQKHLNEPLEITTKVRTTTADTIRHRYWMVSGIHKLDALTRILESETFDGIIVFVRTKSTHGRAFRKAPGPRLFRGAALRRYFPEHAGTHHRAAESGQARYPGGHRCGGPRP